MFFFVSQIDPANSPLFLGKSKLRVGTWGCFASSLAMIYQRPLKEILAIPGAFQDDGDLISSVIANHCGGEAMPPTNVAPKGWCIGRTDITKELKHFLLVNMDTRQQIDPLDLQPRPEPLTYNITQYRPFTNIKLPSVIDVQPVGPFIDIAPDRPSAKILQEAKDLGIISGYPDGTFRPTQPISREDAVGLVLRARKA